jgi:rRNA-processing protein FCF1
VPTRRYGLLTSSVTRISHGLRYRFCCQSDCFKPRSENMVSGHPSSNKLLLDANTLVNAAFLSKSWSRRALESARSRNMTLLVSNVVLDEVKKIIRDAIAGQVVQTDPWVFVEEYCASIAARTVHCGRYSPGCSVKTHDHHIELAARQTNARVIANDIELISSLRALDLPACYPLELFAEGNPGVMETTFFGERPTPKAGSFFFRGEPAGSCEIITWPGFHVSYDHIRGDWTVTEALRQNIRLSDERL